MMFQRVHITQQLLQKFNRYEEPLFYHLIRFEEEFKFPLERTHLFSFETEEAIYYYAYKESKVVQPCIIFISQGNFNEYDYLEGFKKFQDAINLFLLPRKTLLVGRDHYLKPVIQYIKRTCLQFEIEQFEAIEFITKRDQERILMETEERELPEGYSIGNADPKDSEFITNKWKFADDGEVENTVQRISTFPSTSVHFNGKLAGFELVDTLGCLCHQFVLEEYRNKGLGKAIEINIGKKCIRSGITLFKYVELDNVNVVKSSLRSPYWKANLNPDGSYNFMTWIQLTPKN